MGRQEIYLEYLKKIKAIKSYLDDSPIEEKKLKTKIQALDKFFPSLLKRFKNMEYEIFDNTIRKEIEGSNLNNEVFEEFVKISPEKKADLLMKWVISQEEDIQNTYRNYAWRIQGLLSKMGRNYEANPKRMQRIKSNGHHLEEDYTYEEFIQLYELLPTKFKLILKLMLYAGWNGADIVQFKPKDFKRFERTIYYYIEKDRVKTKAKDGKYIIVFHEDFINEIKDYFELPKKRKLKGEEEKTIIKNWTRDKNERIFPITSKTVSDIFKYHVVKNGLNPSLNPSNLRRLCFTRLKEVFSLKDEDIYTLWTQHKAGIITRHYITDLIKRSIKYFETGKLQEAVLIGKIGEIVKEVKELREERTKIDDLKDLIYSLKSENADLISKYTKTMKTLEQHDKILERIEKHYAVSEEGEVIQKLELSEEEIKEGEKTLKEKQK